MSSSETAAVAAEVGRQADALRGLADTLLERGDVSDVSEASIQQGLTTLLKLYAAKWDAGARFSPVVPDGGVTATAVMVITTALLKAVHVELFELGMWQAWSDR